MYDGFLKLVLISNLFLCGNFFFGKYHNHHKLPPIILVPGAGGNRLYAEIHNDREYKNQGCSLKYFGGRFNVWVNLKFLFEPACLAKLLTMQYVNRTIDFFKDGPYAKIYTSEFGPTSNLEYLTEINTPFFGYYKNLVKKLVKIGYIRGINVIGAPYDFRKITLESTKREYFNELTSHSEKLVKFFENKVIIVSHSLGSPLMKMFFQSKSQAWKDEHIYAWFSINGPFSGTPNALRAALVGYNYGLPLAEKNVKFFQHIQSSLPSVYYLMPSERYYGNDYELVKVENQVYTYKNISDIFRAKNIHFAQHARELTEDIWSNVPAGVRTHCVYSNGYQTLKTLVLDSNYKFKKEHQIYADGDGTIPIESLRHCHTELQPNNYTTTYELFPNINHFAAIKDEKVYASLRRLIVENVYQNV